MRAWAVRVKGTGRYLPFIGRSRAHSCAEPAVGFPRLHPTYRSARNTLTAWLLGKWEQHSTVSHYDGEPDFYYAPTKVEGRNKEEMEIVEFELMETNHPIEETENG